MMATFQGLGPEASARWLAMVAVRLVVYSQVGLVAR
jgi:hypothetical protein